MHVEANLCESFGGTGLRAEENGDLLCAIVNFWLQLLHDQRLGRLHDFGFGTVGSPPYQDDNAADEDRNGSGQNHDNLAVLKDKRSHLVCGVGRTLEGSTLPLMIADMRSNGELDDDCIAGKDGNAGEGIIGRRVGREMERASQRW